MANFNLVRNTRVFFTTNVDAVTGVIPNTGASISNTNTFELQVLAGFSFKQGTQTANIQLKEAGNTPTRGQRTFNTSLNPVDFSFSTYIRPKFASSAVNAEERVLWNALMSSVPIDTTGLALSTVAAFTRITNANGVAAATSDTVSFTCAAANLTTAGIAVNDVITVTGITDTSGTKAKEWNTAARILSITGTLTACTGMTLVYLTAPDVSTGLVPSTSPTTLSLRTGAWSNIVTAGSTPVVPAYGQLHFGGSNKNTLQKFGLIFVVDGAIYAIDNCAMDQAVVDFGLDAISMVAWTGKGTVLRQLPATAIVTGSPGVFSGAGNATGTALATVTDAQYITNKLSTLQLIGGIQGTGTAYTLALTGGSLTIANGISYITPQNLGVVNKSIGYYTGTRSITGTVTAYLKTGTGNSAQVLSDILAANAAETKFRLQVEVGGLSNAVHVEFDMDGCMLQVPTVETADIMSTTIGFTAQGSSSIQADQAYDLGNTNDLTIRYFSA
jgi:hypothetical protein